MALAHALRLPVTALASGRASAFQGAFRLTGIDDAVVALAEGSSLVLGALRNGVPRASHQARRGPPGCRSR